MFFKKDGGLLVEQLAGAVGPGEGQGEQAHQLGEALGVGQVGVLEVEAPTLEAAGQGLDLPTVGVGVDGLGLGRAGAGDGQEVAAVQAHHAVPAVGDEGVALEALVGRDALPLQPPEPVLADELAVGQQRGDAARIKDGEEAPVRATRPAVSESPGLSRTPGTPAGRCQARGS